MPEPTWVPKKTVQQQQVQQDEQSANLQDLVACVGDVAKPFYKSKTVNTGIVSIIGAVYMIFGKRIHLDQQQLTGIVLLIVSLIGIFNRMGCLQIGKAPSNISEQVQPNEATQTTSTPSNSASPAIKD